MIMILSDIISTYKVYYIGLNFVRPFQPPCTFCPPFSSLAFSSLALLSVIFLSCIFQPYTFVRHFRNLYFPVLHFQSPLDRDRSIGWLNN